MPIYTTRASELIPFLNLLEENINEMLPLVEQWQKESGRILEGIESISLLDFKASSAMGQAGMALAELGNATAAITVQMPNRLKTLIEQIRAEMKTASENAGNSGGAGYDARINAEIDNAISSVDEVIEDGLKLDYRLRKLQELAINGANSAKRDLVFPFSTTIDYELDEGRFQIPEMDEVIFIPGVVTVLNHDLQPIYAEDGSLIEGTIDETGLVVFNQAPNKKVKLYYPIEMNLSDAPEDFLMIFMDLMLTKNSSMYKSIAHLDTQLSGINEILKQMQGANWTEEFSIMRNQQELIKESIAPKGLDVEVKDGNAHMTFSYTDHPHLSHFIAETWDEATKSWVPYDGQFGVISK